VFGGDWSMMSGGDDDGTHRQARRVAHNSKSDLSDLRALFINCTLKKSPEPVIERLSLAGSSDAEVAEFPA
jgi:hypothetical protein